MIGNDHIQLLIASTNEYGTRTAFSHVLSSGEDNVMYTKDNDVHYPDQSVTSDNVVVRIPHLS